MTRITPSRPQFGIMIPPWLLIVGAVISLVLIVMFWQWFNNLTGGSETATTQPQQSTIAPVLMATPQILAWTTYDIYPAGKGVIAIPIPAEYTLCRSDPDKSTAVKEMYRGQWVWMVRGTTSRETTMRVARATTWDELNRFDPVICY